MLCMRDEEVPRRRRELLRDYFGMHRFEWPDDDGVEFHLRYGDWIRLLRANGFEVEDLIELQAPADAEAHRVRRTCRRRSGRGAGPSEEIWVARKR